MANRSGSMFDVCEDMFQLRAVSVHAIPDGFSYCQERLSGIVWTQLAQNVRRREMIRTRAFRPLTLGATDLAPVVQTLGSAIHKAPVVQKMDRTIHWINHYPVDN